MTRPAVQLAAEVDLRRLAERAGEELEHAPAERILRWAADTFGDRFCLSSSMADAVLAHLAGQVMPGVDVLFVDTGYHFGQTLDMRDAVAARYAVNVVTVSPEPDAPLGLFGTDPDRCCALRKVAPLDRALEAYDAWATGIRRDETLARRRTKVVAWDARRGKVKIAPLARWTQDDLDAYIERHDILVNPLQEQGYLSIGCAPCTRPVDLGADPRSGRWAGLAKTECGLHL